MEPPAHLWRGFSGSFRRPRAVLAAEDGRRRNGGRRRSQRTQWRLPQWPDDVRRRGFLLQATTKQSKAFDALFSSETMAARPCSRWSKVEMVASSPVDLQMRWRP